MGRCASDLLTETGRPISNKTYNVIEQIAVLAQLADEHAWHVCRVFGNTDTPLFDISEGVLIG